MVKVYIGELISGMKVFPIFNKHLGKEKYAGKKAYRAIFDEMDFSFLKIVKKPEDADIFLIPHNYFAVKNNTAYIQEFIHLSQKYKKRIFVFAFGDSDEKITVSNITVLRYAGYRHKGLKGNEIIIPTQIYAGDILEEQSVGFRGKKQIPTVSFCGWAGFNSLRERLRYILKMIPFTIKKYVFFDIYAEVYKTGVYWRKKAIKALEKSRNVETSFIIRNFYTPNKYTVQGDPVELRKEYIENIKNSDFVLVARGDANMAVRFYETLALGRIPVLIDTEWMLPLEDEIDYKKIVVFVPYTDIKNTDRYIRKFWDGLSNDEFKERQKLARKIFMNYLKFDSFLKRIFQNLSKSSQG